MTPEASFPLYSEQADYIVITSKNLSILFLLFFLFLKICFVFISLKKYFCQKQINKWVKKNESKPTVWVPGAFFPPRFYFFVLCYLPPPQTLFYSASKVTVGSWAVKNWHVLNWGPHSHSGEYEALICHCVCISQVLWILKLFAGVHIYLWPAACFGQFRSGHSWQRA